MSSGCTFGKWRARHDWVRLAREHDEKVATAAAEKIAEAAIAGVVTRAAQFDTLATETLQMAIDGLKEIDVASLKATLPASRRPTSAPWPRSASVPPRCTSSSRAARPTAPTT